MKKYISIIAVLFTIGISGCKKDYLSLEANPNSPSTTTPGLTLAAALNNNFLLLSDMGNIEAIPFMHQLRLNDKPSRCTIW